MDIDVHDIDFRNFRIKSKLTPITTDINQFAKNPKEEIPIDIDLGSCLPAEVPLESLTGMEYLRIGAVSILEPMFKSQKARTWFLWRSYEEEENYKSLIAKFDFYFKEGE